MTDPSLLVRHPESRDCLCGKDRRCVNHEGSKLFRDVIETYRHRYSLANTKYQKMMITKEIYERLRQDNVRFLKYNQECDAWEELSPMAARDKVGHALRFANRRVAQKKSTSTTDTGSSKSGTTKCTTSTASSEATSSDSSSRSDSESPAPLDPLELEPVPTAAAPEHQYPRDAPGHQYTHDATPSYSHNYGNEIRPLPLPEWNSADAPRSSALIDSMEPVDIYSRSHYYYDNQIPSLLPNDWNTVAASGSTDSTDSWVQAPAACSSSTRSKHRSKSIGYAHYNPPARNGDRINPLPRSHNAAAFSSDAFYTHQDGLLSILDEVAHDWNVNVLPSSSASSCYVPV